MTTYKMGVDPANPEGDKTIIAGHNGPITIFTDEVGFWPSYRWYRNPIKLIKWKLMWRSIERSTRKSVKTVHTFREPWK